MRVGLPSNLQSTVAGVAFANINQTMPPPALYPIAPRRFALITRPPRPMPTSPSHGLPPSLPFTLLRSQGPSFCYSDTLIGSCLRAFALAIPPAQNTFPADVCMSPFTSHINCFAWPPSLNSLDSPLGSLGLALLCLLPHRCVCLLSVSPCPRRESSWRPLPSENPHCPRATPMPFIVVAERTVMSPGGSPAGCLKVDEQAP